MSKRLEAFLERHGYTGRKPARELPTRLRGGAEGRAGELETQARRQVVLALVSALEPIVARISELTIEIRHPLDAHPDGATFRSLFINPDSWLCCEDDRRDRATAASTTRPTGRSPPAPANPRSRSSPAKPSRRRWAGDHRLRGAFCTLADSSRRHNPWAADIYDRARPRGASHAHAIRILGRACPGL